MMRLMVIETVIDHDGDGHHGDSDGLAMGKS